MSTIYRKTTKGSEAINARLHGLVGRSRSLLILVDGKRSQDELEGLATAFGDVAQMLAQLQADGFVEPVPGSGPPPAATAAPTHAPLAPRAAPVAAPAVAAPVSAKAPATLADTKLFTTRKLLETLGPTSQNLCLRIEAARDMPEFVAAVKRAYAVVKEVRGAAEADRFGASVEANLPPQ